MIKTAWLALIILFSFGCGHEPQPAPKPEDTRRFYVEDEEEIDNAGDILTLAVCDSRTKTVFYVVVYGDYISTTSPNPFVWCKDN